MTDQHTDVGAELLQLATQIIALLDPVIAAAAAATSTAGAEPGKCQQVWCPVCAIAAVASGEQHPLVTIVAEHSTALLTMLRATVGPQDPGSGGDQAAPGATDNPSPEPSRYQHIDVTVID